MKVYQKSIKLLEMKTFTNLNVGLTKSTPQNFNKILYYSSQRKFSSFLLRNFLMFEKEVFASICFQKPPENFPKNTPNTQKDIAKTFQKPFF